MQVESAEELVCAYANQVSWLDHRMEALKKAKTPETDPVYVAVLSELNWARIAHSKMRELVISPKGRLVLVDKCRANELVGRVGRVVSVHIGEKNEFASVQFPGEPKARNLGLSGLTIIDLPVPSTRIPSAGMQVRFQGDPVTYVAVKWTVEKVFVEPIDSVYSGADENARFMKKVWKERSGIASINSVPPI